MENIISNILSWLEYIIPIIAIILAYIAIRRVKEERLSRNSDSFFFSQDKQKICDKLPSSKPKSQ